MLGSSQMFISLKIKLTLSENVQESFSLKPLLEHSGWGCWVRMTGGECSMSKAVTLREAVELEKEGIVHTLNLKPPQPSPLGDRRNAS